MLGLTTKNLRSHKGIFLSRPVMSTSLPLTITQGLLNLPGATAQSKATAERLLEEDRNLHHCFFGKVGFHNHLSHQYAIDA